MAFILEQRARRAFGLSLLAMLTALALVACKPPGAGFSSTDVTGAEFGRDFALTDPQGQPRKLADFRDKVVVVFFGFTQCPDVCPSTLASMAEVMRDLGPRADKVQVIFITLDPERDTPALLAQYAPAFDRRFLGLLGDAEATVKVAKEFKVFYQKVPGSTPGTYSIDHTAGSYIFDPKGRLRLFVKHGQPKESLVKDIGRLLDGA